MNKLVCFSLLICYNQSQENMGNKRLIKQLLIWGGLLIILLAVLWGYKQNWWQRNLVKVSQEQIEQSRQEIDNLMNELAYWGYRIYLADVSGLPAGQAGGPAKGEAAYRFMNDKYEQMVVAELPDLEDGYFYGGWLVRPEPPGQISTGKLFKQADGRYTLFFSDSRNYSDFTRVVITLEPNDGNPEPAQSILEGGFK